MKATCLALLLCASCVGAARLSDQNAGSGISKVVTMLKDMLKKSQDNWEGDQKAFAEFKTYCEDNTDKKTTSIQEGTKTIGLLSNKIEEIQGSSGDLSIKVADLKADMAENKEARDNAKALREKENKAFEAEKKDLNAAVAQMEEALKILSDVGADQTLASGADHEKFMGKYKEKALIGIRSSVRQALTAASYLLDPEKQMKLTAFVQAPFTGTYSAQSGQVVGILKDMKDTFKSNLETSAASEKASKEAYEEFKKNKEDEHADMKKSYDEKQASLGTNDEDLSTKKKQLAQSIKQKDADEDFLGKLTVQCKDKTETYEARKIFATNEEIALNKALSILDNDVASEKFGAVDAAKGSAAFIQLSSRRHHLSAPTGRAGATQFLQKAAKEQQSKRISKILMLLQAGNPFTTVLDQIDNMITMAVDEQKVDDEEKAWCKDTNKDNADNLSDKKDELKTIQGEITKLKNDINDEASGLKFQIKENTESLKTNLENQGKETDTRREENIEYQGDVHTIEDVIETIQNAQQVLKEYYDSLDNEQLGLIQTKEGPKPPDTFAEKYTGSNEQAKEVLKLLEEIRTNSWKEESAAHDTERQSQHDYEDSMQSLTDGEADLQETIVKLNKDLASKEKQLEAKLEDETNTEKEKIAIDRYIEKIKPGCTFVLGKYDDRKKARVAEKKALNTAKSKLKGSPAFKSATRQAKEDGFGKCKATCLKSEAGAKCQACLSGVSVPGYCAGHAGTPGC